MGIIENLKTAVGLAKKIGSIEVQQKLIDVQGEALDRIEKNRTLRERVVALEGELNTKKSLQFRNTFYWTTADDGHEEGPFCSHCYDSGRNLIHLHPINNGRAYGCPACGLVRMRDGALADYMIVRRFNVERTMAGETSKRRR